MFLSSVGQCSSMLVWDLYGKNAILFLSLSSWEVIACLCFFRETIWKLRVDFLQERVLSQWESFTIWNAGKQGRKLYRCLSPVNQKKVCLLEHEKSKKKMIKNYLCLWVNLFIVNSFYVSGKGVLWRWWEQNPERLLYIWGVQGEMRHFVFWST